MTSCKARDIDGLQEEFSKWGVDLLAPYIKKIFNGVNQNNFSMEWTTRIVIHLHKSGDVNKPSNYHAIMVNPLFGKLFRSMPERKINKWAKKRGKRG